MTSGDPPASASQSAGKTGMSHRAWPAHFFLHMDIQLFHHRLLKRLPCLTELAVCAHF